MSKRPHIFNSIWVSILIILQTTIPYSPQGDKCVAEWIFVRAKTT